MGLRLMGRVMVISSHGNLVLRSSFAPDIGSIVYDERKRVIGKVARVFGPVIQPYVAVSPRDKKEAQRFVGKNLYVGEGRNGGKQKKEGKRRR